MRNHPEREATSRLSPYLHFGHIGPLTIALALEAAVKADPKLAKARDSYFNEVITWRELSVNFCRHQPDYDNPGCVDNWARETIARHDLTSGTSSTRSNSLNSPKPTTISGTLRSFRWFTSAGCRIT